jgi:hypothetical protein
VSWTIHGAFSFLADDGTEKLLKRLAGRKEVDDAVLRLDALTKEEILMTAARNLEVTHRINGNVEATKVLTEDIDDNIKVTKDGTQFPLFIFIHV